MSMGSAPKISLERGACIGKAEEPCNATDDNLTPDCYESMHAFKKIRTSTSGLRKSPNKWTKEENQKLASLVASYGEKKWKRISAEMGGQKTGAQCAQHWKRVLSPEIRKGHWDENEEDLLLRLVVQYGSCWKKIAKKIPQRTDIQCRYQYLKAKQSREVLWDAKEDESLTKKVMEMANCNFFQVLTDNQANVSATDNNTNGPNTPSTPLRNSSNYNATPPSQGNSTASNSNPASALNKENDGGLKGSGSDAKEDGKPGGERGKDAWNDDKQNVNMGDGSKDTGNNSWRSGGKEASLSGTCANCHSPVGAHVSKIVWLEISEHMARLKLTSTLRTALECKTRFMELLGNKFSLSGSGDFCLNNSSDSNKSFGLKSSGDIGGLGFGNTLGGSGGIDRGFHTMSDANIGIKINNTNNINPTKINNTTTPPPPPTSTPNTNGCNSNNINLTNCNNNNITINITNSYTTAHTNQHGVNFQQIAHSTSSSTGSSVKMEHSTPPIPAHLLSKTPIPPILSPAPPFPSFSSFPHLPQPTSLKPASVRPMNVGLGLNTGFGALTNGLDSLAHVASILPREMLADYAHF